jgi:hypothetical protein
MKHFLMILIGVMTATEVVAGERFDSPLCDRLKRNKQVRAAIPIPESCEILEKYRCENCFDIRVHGTIPQIGSKGFVDVHTSTDGTITVIGGSR